MIISFGLLIAGVGFFWIGRSLRLRMKGFSTIGTVTEVRMISRIKRSRHLVVSFKTYNKKNIIYHVDAFTPSIKIYQVGDSIPILYDPYKPTDAVVYAFESMYLLPLFIIGFGLSVIYQEIAH